MEWLTKMLNMGQQGGSGGAPFGLGGSSGPAANNGMPISGMGPGMGVNPVSLYAPPGSNVNPGGGVVPGGAPPGSPMNDTGPLNQLNGPAGPGLGLLNGLARRFGVGGAAPAASNANNSNNNNQALSVAQGLLKSPELKPAQFNWMPMAGPR